MPHDDLSSRNMQHFIQENIAFYIKMIINNKGRLLGLKLFYIIYKIYYHFSILRNFRTHPPKAGVVYTPLQLIYILNSVRQASACLYSQSACNEKVQS